MDVNDIRKKATMRNFIAALVAADIAKGPKAKPAPPVRKCLRPGCEKTHQNKNAPYCSADCCELHRKESKS